MSSFAPSRSRHIRAIALVGAAAAALATACVAPQPAPPIPPLPPSTPAPTSPATTSTTTSSIPSGTKGYSTTPTGATRLTGGTARAVVQSSGVAYVGGDFTAVTDGATTLPRQHLVAVTQADGRPVAGFVADTDGMVDAVAVVGNKLYLAGSFTTVNGAARKNLARVDVLSGALDTSFSLDANNIVYDLWLNGTRLYLGGDFTNVGGAARAKVAALDTVTGALVSGFKPNIDRRVSSVATSPDGSTVYLGGRFTTVNSQNVLNLAAVRAGDGALLPQRFADVQAPDPATTTSDILDLDVTPDGTGVIVGIGGQHFNVVGAWDAGTGARRWWHGFDPTDHLDGDVQAVLYNAGTVYFGFHGGYNGNTNRRLMAADASTGILDASFRPTMNGIVGVADLSTDGGVLSAVGDFTNASGISLGGLAFFPRLA